MTVNLRRYITGCAAAHPDQRGGQHVSMSCTAVIAIDDARQVGVLVMNGRSQFKNKQLADELLTCLLDDLRNHEDKDGA